MWYRSVGATTAIIRSFDHRPTTKQQSTWTVQLAVNFSIVWGVGLGDGELYLPLSLHHVSRYFLSFNISICLYSYSIYLPLCFGVCLYECMCFYERASACQSASCDGLVEAPAGGETLTQPIYPLDTIYYTTVCVWKSFYTHGPDLKKKWSVMALPPPGCLPWPGPFYFPFRLKKNGSYPTHLQIRCRLVLLFS
jgi:hypothetical protein